MGKWFYSDNAAVAVAQIDKSSKIGPWTPSKDYIFVSIGLVYANRGDSGIVHCNPFNFQLKTGQAVIYNPSPASLEPELKSVDLAPGGKIEGWLTFEIKADATDLTLLWEPSLFAEAIEIPLK